MDNQHTSHTNKPLHKKSTFLAWILRMPLIKRWALMHCVKKENIAEHSHQVAVIAHLLAVIRNTYFNGQLIPERAATIALYHECSETKLQDINHVTKYHNPQLTKEFKKLEYMAEVDCVKSLPAELQAHFRALIIQDEVDPQYKELVKAADLISAYFKAKDELRFSNAEFSHVALRLTEMLEEYRLRLPEVDYFLQTFGDSCFVSVDQLSQSTN